MRSNGRKKLELNSEVIRKLTLNNETLAGINGGFGSSSVMPSIHIACPTLDSCDMYCQRE